MTILKWTFFRIELCQSVFVFFIHALNVLHLSFVYVDFI
jgi:hypothetical protein